MSAADCVICRGPAGDAELDRELVRENRLWRLTTSLPPSVHFHVNLALRRVGHALLAEPAPVDPAVRKPGRHEHVAVVARLCRSTAQRF